MPCARQATTAEGDIFVRTQRLSATFDERCTLSIGIDLDGPDVQGGLQVTVEGYLVDLP